MMLKQLQRIAAGGILSLALVAVTPFAIAESPTAVPTLDLNKYMGTWYEIARYPVAPEKRCVSDAMVLYALGDKKNTFQVVTSCKLKDGNTDSWNANGKTSKTADGRLKLSHLLIFSKKYWVLALAPDSTWALVGSPNRKSLWILSRTTALKPETLTDIQSKAAAMGFNTAKLKPMPQN
jgi:apolipoprotein D and lipocalin family protein